MKKLISILPLLFFMIQPIHAQLSITAADTDFVIDFESSINGVNNGKLSGSGLLPDPGEGQIDSDGLIVNGISGGDMSFGSTRVSGEYVLGTSTGGESSGGLYAFEVSAGNNALGIQPTINIFTPGSIILKVINASGGNVNSFKITYKIYFYNDQDRSSSLKFYYSKNDTTYFNTSTLDYTSVQSKDVSPAWFSTMQSVKISCELQDGAALYLKWEGADAGGSGSRDEFGLDDIVIAAYQEDIKLIISEVADNSTSDQEYVEIYNGGPDPVDIEGWKLVERYNANNIDERGITFNNFNQKNSGGTDYLKLSNGEYAVVVRNDPVSLKSVHIISDEAAIFENFWPPAMTGDERYQLLNALGDVIDNFGVWEYAGAGSFRLTVDKCYERRNNITDDGSLEANWTSTDNSVYNYTPASGNFTPLPVELVFFNSKLKNGSVLLYWQTATEVNNYGFDIERMSIYNQPYSFKIISEWKFVDFVQGHGSSYSTKNYSYLDYPDRPGKYLYRLKQIDLNGRFEYSDTITVCLPESKPRIKLMQNYPNPANPVTTIEYIITADSRQSAVGSRKKSDYRKQQTESKKQTHLSGSLIPESSIKHQESSTRNQMTGIQYQESNNQYPESGIQPASSSGRNLISVNVKVMVYDILGKQVAALVNDEQPAGEYKVEFDASKLSSGIYFYSIKTPQGSVTKKMIIMK